MLMTTVVAVALGLAPINSDGSVPTATDGYAKLVGPYSQTVDRRGTTHINGFNGLTGRSYDLTIDKHGYVQASVGVWFVTFRAMEQS